MLTSGARPGGPPGDSANPIAAAFGPNEPSARRTSVASGRTQDPPCRTRTGADASSAVSVPFGSAKIVRVSALRDRPLA